MRLAAYFAAAYFAAASVVALGVVVVSYAGDGAIDRGLIGGAVSWLIDFIGSRPGAAP